MVLIEMVGAVSALLTHLYVTPRLKRDFTGGWYPIACYTVGVLLTFPLFVLAYNELKGVNWITRVTAAWAVSFGSVGAGTVLAYYLDGPTDSTGGPK